jgi:Cu2+-exporting ATPase
MSLDKHIADNPAPYPSSADAHNCFHCETLCPLDKQKKPEFTAQIQGKDLHFCCQGCLSICEMIFDQKLDAFYTHRDQQANYLSELQLKDFKAPDAVTTDTDFAHYDSPEYQQDFVTLTEQGKAVRLLIPNIHCAACIWLIEHQLKNLGLDQVSIHSTDKKLQFLFSEENIKLSEIISRIHAIGYQVEPFQSHKVLERYQQENKDWLKRIGLAALVGMQIMMLATGFYLSNDDIAPERGFFMRLISAALATPVYFYAAAPILKGAWRNFKNKSIGMDIPIAIALSGAFWGSLWQTFTSGSEVYFDSMVMFTLFISLAKFYQFRVQYRAFLTDYHSQNLPKEVSRLQSEHKNQYQKISTHQVQIGDQLLLKPGDMLTHDAQLASKQAWINESILNGESTAQAKSQGAQLRSGSINLRADSLVTVTANAQSSFAQSLSQQAEQAFQQKPQILNINEKRAALFSSVILALAVFAGGFALLTNAPHAFTTFLTVLVISCPCALAISIPVALNRAYHRMQHVGVHCKNLDAIFQIPAITHCLTDKTGTLTLPDSQFHLTWCSPEYAENEVIQWAVALEHHAQHPLAQPFLNHESQVALHKIKHHDKGIQASLSEHNTQIAIGHTSLITDLDAAFENTGWLEKLELPQLENHHRIVLFITKQATESWHPIISTL